MKIDVHTHPFADKSRLDLGDKIRSVPDLIIFRSRHADLHRRRTADEYTDIIDELILTMDRHGVKKALIQAVRGKVSNQQVAEAAAKHPDRLFPLITLSRSHPVKPAVGTPSEAKAEIEETIRLSVDELRMRGVGEVRVADYTEETNPKKIARDLAPVMEAVAKHRGFASASKS